MKNIRDAITRLGTQMDRVDLELFDAEKADNVSAQIVALRERAELWRQYGKLLEQAGAESYAAQLSARRDDTSADALTRGAM